MAPPKRTKSAVAKSIAIEGVVSKLIIAKESQFCLQSVESFCIEVATVKKNVFLSWDTAKCKFNDSEEKGDIFKTEQEFSAAPKKFKDALVALWTNKRKAIFVFDANKNLEEIRMLSA